MKNNLQLGQFLGKQLPNSHVCHCPVSATLVQSRFFIADHLGEMPFFSAEKTVSYLPALIVCVVAAITQCIADTQNASVSPAYSIIR